ncbi:MAG: energy-coupling factor transporter transmembrane component T [Chloroflexota bacterium]|nr:energy-coupling factor transporter transmembrane component T [Chloroflexota bacterium]
MTSFRYKDKATSIHRLNPFCKLTWVGSILVLALILDHPFFLLVLFLSTLPVVIAANVVKEWGSFMRFAAYLCLAIVAINVLIDALVGHNGTTILAQAPFQLPLVGTPAVTLEAAFFGIMMCLRLLSIISAFTLLTLTVNPDDMMLSMIKMKLPYKSVLVTSLSTRFFPTLVDDAERITDVQRSRGLELDKGGLTQRIRGRMSIITPLLSNSLDRTVQVAEAMESRGFGNGTKRTFYKDIQFSRIDIVTLLTILSVCALGIAMTIQGYGDYQYYPTLGEINLGVVEWIILPILVVFLSSIVLLASLKRRTDLD